MQGRTQGQAGKQGNGKSEHPGMSYVRNGRSCIWREDNPGMDA
jgi:hypothetical protein